MLIYWSNITTVVAVVVVEVDVIISNIVAAVVVVSSLSMLNYLYTASFLVPLPALPVKEHNNEK